MDSSPSTITAALEHIILFNYLDVASIAILLFDYFLTIDLEIKYIWNSKWSIPNIMFLFTRYLPFIESAVLLYRTFSPSLSIEKCNQAYKVNALLILVGIIVAEIILSLRTWAVWGKSKLVGIGLIIFSLAAAIPAIPVIVLFSGTAKFVDPPYKPFRGCFLEGGSRILSTEWILLMIYDGSLLGLMAVQAFLSLPIANEPFLKTFFTSSQPTELLKSILKDGILYYIYLFVLSALNVVVIMAMPIDFINLLTMIERVIHAVLTCRVVLRIKDSARTEASDDSMTYIDQYGAATTMEFEVNHNLDPEP